MIISSHIHAGHGTGLTDSWTTLEDTEISLKRRDEAGIDRAVILPFENLDSCSQGRPTESAAQQGEQ